MERGYIWTLISIPPLKPLLTSQQYCVEPTTSIKMSTNSLANHSRFLTARSTYVSLPYTLLLVSQHVECFSLLMLWACLISPFTRCVTCHHSALKQLLFSPACTYLWLSTGTSVGKFAFCCVYFEGFSLFMFWACLISRFICCVTCCHYALKQLFFLLHVHTYGCPLEHQDVSLFSVVCIFKCFSLLMFWACLISRFTCCVTCRHCALKQLFFFCCMYIHMAVYWNIRM